MSGFSSRYTPRYRQTYNPVIFKKTKKGSKLEFKGSNSFALILEEPKFAILTQLGTELWHREENGSTEEIMRKFFLPFEGKSLAKKFSEFESQVSVKTQAVAVDQFKLNLRYNWNAKLEKFHKAFDGMLSDMDYENSEDHKEESLEVSEEEKKKLEKQLGFRAKKMVGEALKAFRKKNPEASEEEKEELKVFLKGALSLGELPDKLLSVPNFKELTKEEREKLASEFFAKLFIKKVEGSPLKEDNGETGKFLRKALKEAKKGLKEMEEPKASPTPAQPPLPAAPETKVLDLGAFQEGVQAWFFTKPYFNSLDEEVQEVFKTKIPVGLLVEMVSTVGFVKAQELTAFDIVRKIKGNQNLTAMLRTAKVWGKVTEAMTALEQLGHVYDSAAEPKEEVTDVQPKAPQAPEVEPRPVVQRAART